LNIVKISFAQLIEVHAQGIVHRDIKPDNLLLDAHDVLKIVDFGVSEMFTKEDDRLKSSNGSPAFSSPELSQPGVNIVSGKAADIWAMGITLYALIYGYLPFNNHNVLELYDNINHQEYVPSRTFLIEGCSFLKTKIKIL
jgi:[calcium/calmodulin-dependent protein kinase] kinase